MNTQLPAAPNPMHRWQGRNGIGIAGDAWGEPDAPLVLLLHGGGQTRHAWKGAGEMLAAAGYQAVALDARGHGDSQWDPQGEYSDDVLVDDLVHILEGMAAEPAPVLVGASMGGITSLIAIGEERVKASGLVLVDVAAHLEPEGVANVQAFMRNRPEGFESLEEVAEAIANYQPHRRRPRNLDGLAKNVRLGADGRYRWHWDPQFRNRINDFPAREARLVAAAGNLRRVPALLVRGALSDVLSEQGAAEFLALCPHAEYVNVTGGAHMVAGDRNDIFANAVVDFLSRAVPSADPSASSSRAKVQP